MPSLKQRISRGRVWLLENIDHPNYKEALTLYESLVNEAKKQGINEKDCWETDKVDGMTKDEVLTIFTA